MAIMKIKNENGEWVTGAPVNFLHQFKFAFVPDFRKEGETYYRHLDLSPYVQKNSDFMLIAKPSTSSGQGTFQVYIHSDGKTRQFSTALASGNNINTLDFPFPESNTCSFTYDEDTRILTYDDKTHNIYDALLIYAG